jgi:surfeit locus 1 family protein
VTDRVFRPKPLPILLTVLMVAVLLGLGVWQLQRLEWKTDLIAELEQRTAAAPISLTEALETPDAVEYRPVRVTGRWLHDRTLHLVARTYRGAPGLHLVTPLRLSDGRSLLVDRGWVPLTHVDPARREAGRPEGIVTVVGLARLPGWTGSEFAKPENDPADNEWLWIDAEAMAAAVGLERPIADLYLSARDDQHPGDYPVGGRTRVELENNHLQYAITWFVLAAAAIVVFGLSQRRKAD